MSYSRSFGSTSTTQYYEKSVRAEYDKWIAEAGKRNAAGLKAAGVQVIDFNVRRL
jgi:hypothetical protein